jgi:hypothetical protein
VSYEALAVSFATGKHIYSQRTGRVYIYILRFIFEVVCFCFGSMVVSYGDCMRF